MTAAIILTAVIGWIGLSIPVAMVAARFVAGPEKRQTLPRQPRLRDQARLRDRIRAMHEAVPQAAR